MLASKTNVKVIELRGKLHLDLTFQERAMVGSTKLVIRMITHNPNFYLEVKAGYTVKVEFIDPHLEIHRARVTDLLIKGHKAALAHGTAKYPICRSEVIPFNIAKGYVDFMQDNLICGQIPRRIFAAFVSNEAFLGSYKKNPFYFEHCYISYFTISIDGKHYPGIPYKPDFKKDKYGREHTSLFQVLGQNGTDSYLETLKERIQGRIHNLRLQYCT